MRIKPIRPGPKMFRKPVGRMEFDDEGGATAERWLSTFRDATITSPGHYMVERSGQGPLACLKPGSVTAVVPFRQHERVVSKNDRSEYLRSEECYPTNIFKLKRRPAFNGVPGVYWSRGNVPENGTELGLPFTPRLVKSVTIRTRCRCCANCLKVVAMDRVSRTVFEVERAVARGDRAYFATFTMATASHGESQHAFLSDAPTTFEAVQPGPFDDHSRYDAFIEKRREALWACERDLKAKRISKPEADRRFDRIYADRLEAREWAELVTFLPNEEGPDVYWHKGELYRGHLVFARNFTLTSFAARAFRYEFTKFLKRLRVVCKRKVRYTIFLERHPGVGKNGEPLANRHLVHAHVILVEAEAHEKPTAKQKVRLSTRLIKRKFERYFSDDGVFAGERRFLGRPDVVAMYPCRENKHSRYAPAQVAKYIASYISSDDDKKSALDTTEFNWRASQHWGKAAPASYAEELYRAALSASATEVDEEKFLQCVAELEARPEVWIKPRYKQLVARLLASRAEERAAEEWHAFRSSAGAAFYGGARGRVYEDFLLGEVFVPDALPAVAPGEAPF